MAEPKECFIKKAWEEENIIICIHFRGEDAIRQLEIYPDRIARMPDDMVYDQGFSDIDWKPEDFISGDEFEELWNKGKYYGDIY